MEALSPKPNRRASRPRPRRALLLRRLVLWPAAALGAGMLALAAPVARTEIACRGEARPQAAPSVLRDPADRRAEARAFLSYPEWHIVYAYEDLAHALRRGDPHDFAYLPSIAGFWGSLCALTERADAHGGAGLDAKLTIHTIGVSFTLEMLAKGAYEETVGRLFAALRGGEDTAQDEVEGRMAQVYGEFLHQTPWYRFDFDEWTAELWRAPIEDDLAPGLRGWERRIALGLEWRAKAAYAQLIGSAAGALGADEARMRVHVRGLDPSEIGALEDARPVRETAEGLVLDVPRYRVFTRMVESIAALGGEVTEIAGNDDILVSVLGEELPALPESAEPLMRMERPGLPEDRFLVALDVARLDDLVRALDAGSARLEHVHDY